MFYFAYGSNMNWPQMRRRCPSSRFVCTARLPGYRFAIARHSRLRNCGTANIFLEAGSHVWGVVYDVSENDMVILDGFEDGYGRHNLSVWQQGEKPLSMNVTVYIAPRENSVPLPNADYKRLMVEGARHWCLPTSYCLMLEQVESG